MTRLGRKPQGAGLVTPLPGSAHAKRRLTLFLQTLSGQCSVGEACAELGIGESRFFAQRAAWLEQSLALLEPRTAGRPPKLPLLAGERDVKVLREGWWEPPALEKKRPSVALSGARPAIYSHPDALAATATGPAASQLPAAG
jgi:hypothetical protein